ncbi:MAG: peptide deformylase [Bacteroidales bacterium]|nr:peptide deformylase [Bacteroidales bacterium]
MILPIVAYGHPDLRKKSSEVSWNEPWLKTFINDLWETMYAIDGVGLAAPQVHKNIRVFVIDTSYFVGKYPEAGYRGIFINPFLIETWGEEWYHSEGCLSIPGIYEDVARKKFIRIRFQNESGETKEEIFEGIVARVILHEYDHLEGILFTDRLTPLRKLLIKNKLNDIAKGKVNVSYKMIFATQK